MLKEKQNFLIKLKLSSRAAHQHKIMFSPDSFTNKSELSLKWFFTMENHIKIEICFSFSSLLSINKLFVQILYGIPLFILTKQKFHRNKTITRTRFQLIYCGIGLRPYGKENRTHEIDLQFWKLFSAQFFSDRFLIQYLLWKQTDANYYKEVFLFCLFG